MVICAAPTWLSRGNENMIVDMDNYAALSPPAGIRRRTKLSGKEVADDDSLTSVLLPVGDGLLAAKKEWSPEAG